MVHRIIEKTGEKTVGLVLRSNANSTETDYLPLLRSANETVKFLITPKPSHHKHASQEINQKQHIYMALDSLSLSVTAPN